MAKEKTLEQNREQRFYNQHPFFVLLVTIFLTALVSAFATSLWSSPPAREMITQKLVADNKSVMTTINYTNNNFFYGKSGTVWITSKNNEEIREVKVTKGQGEIERQDDGTFAVTIPSLASGKEFEIEAISKTKLHVKSDLNNSFPPNFPWSNY
jgi:hypothetical protein